jgi:hypothetical protein
MRLHRCAQVHVLRAAVSRMELEVEKRKAPIGRKTLNYIKNPAVCSRATKSAHVCGNIGA